MSEDEIRGTIHNVNAAIVAERQSAFRARAFAVLVGGSVLAASVGLAACGGSKPAQSPGGGTEGAGGAETETATPSRDDGPMPPYMAP
ncbi:MAG: hypothetical protein JRI68_27140 [Deltaproteobacteria bacterium]|nr:hypothetical protein [Deltaproteobacteria bacterium]